MEPPTLAQLRSTEATSGAAVAGAKGVTVIEATLIACFNGGIRMGGGSHRMPEYECGHYLRAACWHTDADGKDGNVDCRWLQSWAMAEAMRVLMPTGVAKNQTSCRCP